MKKNRILTFTVTAFVLLALAVIGLTNSSFKPPVRTIEQSIPNDRIPH